MRGKKIKQGRFQKNLIELEAKTLREILWEKEKRDKGILIDIQEEDRKDT